jgi:hypothetical protein
MTDVERFSVGLAFVRALVSVERYQDEVDAVVHELTHLALGTTCDGEHEDGDGGDPHGEETILRQKFAESNPTQGPFTIQ